MSAGTSEPFSFSRLLTFDRTKLSNQSKFNNRKSSCMDQSNLIDDGNRLWVRTFLPGQQKLSSRSLHDRWHFLRWGRLYFAALVGVAVFFFVLSKMESTGQRILSGYLPSADDVEDSPCCRRLDESDSQFTLQRFWSAGNRTVLWEPYMKDLVYEKCSFSKVRYCCDYFVGDFHTIIILRFIAMACCYNSFATIAVVAALQFKHIWRCYSTTTRLYSL